MTEWQPIETAPRDGTEILIWREYDGITQCRWVMGLQAFGQPYLFNFDPDDGPPTHWMPLPEPPK